MSSLMESSRSSWRRPAYLAGVRKKREIGFWACLSRFPSAQNPLPFPFERLPRSLTVVDRKKVLSISNQDGV